MKRKETEDNQYNLTSDYHKTVGHVGWDPPSSLLKNMSKGITILPLLPHNE
jgi:hypothetical protein